MISINLIFSSLENLLLSPLIDYKLMQLSPQSKNVIMSLPELELFYCGFIMFLSVKWNTHTHTFFRQTPAGKWSLFVVYLQCFSKIKSETIPHDRTQAHNYLLFVYLI